MRDILIACTTKTEAERGMRLAADLSAASGARVSLLAATALPVTIAAGVGLDAIGHLSNVLFASPRAGSAPSFLAPHPEWLDDLQDRLHDCWATSHLAELVQLRQPDLVIACNRAVGRELVARTDVPIWYLRGQERSWFSARTLRCAVRGARALQWAHAFASSLNADLEASPARLFRNAADLMVVDRDQRAAWHTTPPLVVV